MASKFTLDSREVFATNRLIKDEMQHVFTEMFAGRGMERIPTPAEFRRLTGGLGRSVKIWRQIPLTVRLLLILAIAAGLLYAGNWDGKTARL